MQPQYDLDERRRTKVCDCLPFRIVKVNEDIRLTDKVEECVPELPADVDPVTMVGDGREGLPSVEGPSSETKMVTRPHRKPDRAGQRRKG